MDWRDVSAIPEFILKRRGANAVQLQLQLQLQRLASFAYVESILEALDIKARIALQLSLKISYWEIQIWPNSRTLV